MLHESLDLVGKLTVFERRGRRWRRVYQTENIFLNQHYVDLFTQWSQPANAASILQMVALALGIGTTTPARTDVGLANEWLGTNVAATTSSLASGTPITAVPVTPLSVALPAAAALTLAGQAMTVSGAGAAIGATSIPVNSVTPSPTIPTGTQVVYAAISGSITPQRAGQTNASVNTADPPQVTLSFYLPAGSNSVAVQFQEAGMLYNNPSLAAGGAGRFASHAAFSYQKPPNTDVRIDYTVARTST